MCWYLFQIRFKNFTFPYKFDLFLNIVCFDFLDRVSKFSSLSWEVYMSYIWLSCWFKLFKIWKICPTLVSVKLIFHLIRFINNNKMFLIKNEKQISFYNKPLYFRFSSEFSKLYSYNFKTFLSDVRLKFLTILMLLVVLIR